jgi:hypothetical protein
MKRIITFFSLACLLFFLACSQKNTKGSTQEEKKDSLVEKTGKSEKTEDANQSADSQSITPEEISKKLQGKWRSLDDAKSIIVFEGEYHIDIYEKEELEKEKFSIAKACPPSENPNLKSDKYEYLVVGDMCWSIDTLDEKNLILMYTARGNILRYEKIK